MNLEITKFWYLAPFLLLLPSILSAQKAFQRLSVTLAPQYSSFIQESVSRGPGSIEEEIKGKLGVSLSATTNILQLKSVSIEAGLSYSYNSFKQLFYGIRTPSQMFDLSARIEKQNIGIAFIARKELYSAENAPIVSAQIGIQPAVAFGNVKNIHALDGTVVNDPVFLRPTSIDFADFNFPAFISLQFQKRTSKNHIISFGPYFSYYFLEDKLFLLYTPSHQYDLGFRFIYSIARE